MMRLLRWSLVTAILLGVQWYYGLFVAYPLMAGTLGIWAGLDSRRTGLDKWESGFNGGPLGVAVTVAVALPITFPLYLVHRGRAVRGDLKPAERTGRLSVVQVVFIVACILMYAVVPRLIATRSADLVETGKALADSVGTGFRLGASRSEVHLYMQVPGRAADSAANHQRALGLARLLFRLSARARSADSVVVEFVTPPRMDEGIEVTYSLARYAWRPGALGGLSPSR